MANDIREDLLEQLKNLLESDNAPEAFVKAKALAKRWPRIHEEEESFLDIELSEKFNSMLNELSKKAGEVAVNTEERKNAIIEEAKALLEGSSIEKASKKMKDLMDSWKAAGRTQSKEKDDELWEQFSAVRKEFFDKRKEYYDNLHETFAQNKAAKEELIAKAKEIAEIKDMKKASNAELQAWFDQVLPDWDRDRVYPSDIRKLIQWYNILINAGITDFTVKDEEEEAK